VTHALVQDAAGQLARAVAGLPADEAAEVLQNAVTTVVLRVPPVRAAYRDGVEPAL
jgi:DNA-directed RNA polymerase specialized sigma24 family protein